MDNILEHIGAISAILISIGGLIKALNLLIKRLPILANNIKDLFNKDNWKRK